MSNLGDASSADVRRAGNTVRDAANMWWIFLFSGSAWLLFSIIIFRFDWTSVSSISILFGIAMLAAGVEELFAAAGAERGWTIAYALLGIACIVIGIVAFVNPGGTFKALAAVISFYFIIKGAFTVVLALMSHGEQELWWLLLIVGLAELLLGFWAAGDFGHREILLLVWVGAVALARGLTQFLLAFRLRAVKHAHA
jgi:uncharacterized membrane protein HdeD (DUF308 family)